MHDDIQQWLKTCLECQVNKNLEVTLSPIWSVHQWIVSQQISSDLPGNKYILVVTDSFTKWVEICALLDQSAKRCVSVLLNEVIGHFGTPLIIHSDQGHN